MAEQEQNLGKSVRMPSIEELLKRLPEGTLGLTFETDSFYIRFINFIAESDMVGSGLNMAWESAYHYTSRAYLRCPLLMRVAVNFDKVVDAISPDPQVAEEAKRSRRKFLEDIERQRKAVV